MQLEEAKLEEVMTSLFGFVGHVVQWVRQITLPLMLGDGLIRRIIMVLFLVVDVPSAYNIILG